MCTEERLAAPNTPLLQPNNGKPRSLLLEAPTPLEAGRLAELDLVHLDLFAVQLVHVHSHLHEKDAGITCAGTDQEQGSLSFSAPPQHIPPPARAHPRAVDIHEHEAGDGIGRDGAEGPRPRPGVDHESAFVLVGLEGMGMAQHQDVGVQLPLQDGGGRPVAHGDDLVAVAHANSELAVGLDLLGGEGRQH